MLQRRHHHQVPMPFILRLTHAAFNKLGMEKEGGEQQQQRQSRSRKLIPDDLSFPFGTPTSIAPATTREKKRTQS